MKVKSSYIIYILAVILSINVSCKTSPTDDSGLGESLKPIEEVDPITGGESTTITVNKSSKAFISVELSEVGANDIIQDGTKEAWCLDWDTYIDSNGGTYRDIPLYSTFLVEEWMRINYLLNIQEKLQINDSEIRSPILRYNWPSGPSVKIRSLI